MILYQGQIYENLEQERLISSLQEDLLNTLSSKPHPTIEAVVNACDKLYQRVMNHEFDDIALPLLHALNMPASSLEGYAKHFSKEGLLRKVEIELGDLAKGELPLDDKNVRCFEPLGILFHIAAGNVDLLPAYSVVEGLLVGNINILKLPSGDNGLSVLLLNELIKEEPSLKDFIYVFDVPSTEVETIKRLSSLADATIVWGGDEAQKAARSFVDIRSSIISWGHKISFSYIDLNVTDDEIEALCRSVCLSNQLYCSSSQGVYINTDSMEDLHHFARRTLPIFAKVSKEMGTLPLTMKARNTVLLYNEKLEGNGTNLYQEAGISIVVKDDDKLEPSFLFQNLWIKRLKEEDIVKALKSNKNLLQTVSINQGLRNKEAICHSLGVAGVTRVVPLGENSRMISGESHDGEYALRRYIRIVEKCR